MCRPLICCAGGRAPRPARDRDRHHHRDQEDVGLQGDQPGARDRADARPGQPGHPGHRDRQDPGEPAAARRSRSTPVREQDDQRTEPDEVVRPRERCDRRRQQPAQRHPEQRPAPPVGEHRDDEPGCSRAPRSPRARPTRARLPAPAARRASGSSSTRRARSGRRRRTCPAASTRPTPPARRGTRGRRRPRTSPSP